jgi:hypothetical protein
VNDLRKSFNQAAVWVQETFKHDWVFFGALLLVMAAAYALKISGLGFYWDDWQTVFNSRFTHLLDYWNYWLSNRPIGSWVWMLTVPALGVSPLPWQIMSLLVRWAGTLAFYKALKSLWPQYTWQVRWMVLLLVVFPGFHQQSLSADYIQHFITFGLFALSLWAMIAALHRPKRFWLLTPLALLACLVHVFTMEYFIGLELLRPVILWFLLRERGEKLSRSTLKVLKLWAPYLAILFVFLGWRFIYFPRIMPEPDPNSPTLLLNLAHSPFSTMLTFAQAILQDSVYLVVFAWANTIQASSINLSLFSTLYSWAIGLGLATLLAWALSKTDGIDLPETGRPDSFTGQAALLGVLGILGGGLPVWALGSQIIVGKWADRYALAPMIGVVILVVCVMDWLLAPGKPARKSILLALLLGFSTAAQIRTTAAYRRDWQIQRYFYWQLNWRVPALKPGTAVLGTQMPLNYSADYAIGLALNLIYAPNLHSTNLPYWFIDAPRSHGSSHIPDFKENLPVRYVMRDQLFQSNTSQAVVVDYNSGQGCVYVMSPADALRPGTSDAQASLLKISHPDQIETDPAKAVSPPETIFGVEPFHGWCYYYEKADLARQMGDWQQIAALDQSAGQAGYTTKLGVELIPFIEGYAHLGQWQKAYQYTLEANEKTSGMQPFLCQTWDRITKGTSTSPEREKVWSTVDQKLNCSGR